MKAILFSIFGLLMLSQITSLRAKVSDEIKFAVASKERPESETSRDEHRKPGEILQLLGIKPGMRVIDLSAATGGITPIYYREL